MRLRLCVLLTALAGSAHAAADSQPPSGSAAAALTARPPRTAALKPPTPEELRQLKRCNAQAAQQSLKGTARRRFMGICLHRK